MRFIFTIVVSICVEGARNGFSPSYRIFFFLHFFFLLFCANWLEFYPILIRSNFFFWYGSLRKPWQTRTIIICRFRHHPSTIYLSSIDFKNTRKISGKHFNVTYQTNITLVSTLKCEYIHFYIGNFMKILAY